jgi:uncharacterized protein YceH (UPF0502 family)
MRAAIRARARTSSRPANQSPITSLPVRVAYRRSSITCDNVTYKSQKSNIEPAFPVPAPQGSARIISSVNPVLNPMEARVLGALIEKDITTPDYYPLSLHALVNACNQKSNRDPVMSLDENAVRDALYSLNEKGLAGAVSSADSRVSKYEHRLQETYNLARGETAILCVLLLRGPQTPGELRGRSERMFSFNDLSDVQAALQRLIQREAPLVKMLTRQPGTKEARYAHLLCGEVEGPEAASEAVVTSASLDGGRITRLEIEVGNLKSEVAALRQELEGFRKQFE